MCDFFEKKYFTSQEILSFHFFSPRLFSIFFCYKFLVPADVPFQNVINWANQSSEAVSIKKNSDAFSLIIYFLNKAYFTSNACLSRLIIDKSKLAEVISCFILVNYSGILIIN